ncbi:uncharacterized protein LOC131161446 [Malania oleifera]|uniref:uncharacterized protein LOC131161446 n=1 Tax=Malania oleifera TaxID=397392 RepID=UPI0025ADDA3F|nr:uncharacterized protein LOC131161446 [Malania oleifera]
MAISDAVASNLTTLYLAVIAAMKAYGLVTGRSFSSGLVLVLSTVVVGLILVGTLAWDVSRKAAHALSRDPASEACRGGICWHGVAVRSPASQVRFRLPQQQQQQQQQPPQALLMTVSKGWINFSTREEIEQRVAVRRVAGGTRQ